MACLLLLLQLLVEGVGFVLGRVEFLLRGFQLLLPLRLGVLHLVLQDFVLFLSSFLHLFGDAQSLLALLWLSKHS